ncbi:ATP-binding cassette domain-containing protein [uncultured Roseivirga sp.]|uniref:ATP-binding cassette domain-containing protein n=1 Tax=uncultured Roseivirga sp. TaxID=543088 RepID=UPI0030DB2C61
MDHIYFNFDNNKIEIADGQVMSIGRKGFGADLEIDDRLASRRHAAIELRGQQLFIQDTKSLNGVYLNERRIAENEWVLVGNYDKVKIVSSYLSLVTENTEPSPTDDKSKEDTEYPLASIHSKPEPKQVFAGVKDRIMSQGKLRIGRKPDNDIVIDDPTVGRYHAEVIYEEGQFWLVDLDSLNGTYLNGNERVKGKTLLTDTDNVVIALNTFNLLEGRVDLRKQKYAISAKNIFKEYPNNKVGLQPLSVDIPYSNFVALMGPSGCGKSTLLKCLNGDNPATQGEVLIHGLALKKNFNLLKRKIGYVPQDDIIHTELTVYKTLFYAAKLRLPDDTSNKEIDVRINKVIESLNLDQDKDTDVRKVRVRDLSGGQRKRVSIAVELLVEPTILFLDEPTSPLDPESIDSFLKSLQKLAKEGTTIIMVTHKPEDLNYVDNVIFLMVKGYLTYFGKAGNLNAHFQVDDIVKVYAKLSDKGKLQKHIEQYYVRPIERAHRSANNVEIERDKPDSLMVQFFWLFSRYLKIKTTDNNSVLLLVSQPVIIASLICLIFDEMTVGVLFLMSVSAIWFGVSNASKEIVSELAIYRRERMFNLNLNTYIFSKWSVLAIISFVQTLIFVAILYVKFRALTVEGYDNIYLQSFSGSIAYMFFISFSAILIGLWLSSYFDTTEKVMTVVPIALMPQIMLSGVITKIDNVLIEFFSFFMLGRWGTEGLARIQDGASQIAEKGEVQSVFFIGINPMQPGSALTRLDYYNEELLKNGDLIGGIFDTLQANISVVMVMNLVVYLMIYYSLKRKDSI